MPTVKTYLVKKNNKKTQRVPHQDQKYIEALRTNNYVLVEEIYKNYAPIMTNLIKQNSGSEEDALDLFQEVLIILHRYAQEGFVLSCSLKSFLYTLCKRRWLNELKKKGRSHTLKVADISDLNFAEESMEFVEGTEEYDDRFNFCKEKFNMLSNGCKEILQLAWRKQENGNYSSWKEIAEELEISYGYIRKKASQCKARLTELARKDPGFKNYN